MTDQRELETILNICAEEKVLLRADRDSLREQVAELLEALERIADLPGRYGPRARAYLADDIAAAAIAKHKERA